MPTMSMDDAMKKKILEEILATTPITPMRWNIRHYTEPCQVETDEEGNIYGYKVLIWDVNRRMFVSPVYPAYWNYQGELTADKNPGRTQSHGIYFLKSGSDPELTAYYHQAEYRSIQYGSGSKVFTVRCMLFGTIVEAERGFRVEHAKIEGVMHDGYWNTYQNFRAEAEAYRQRSNSWEVSYKGWEKITRYDYTARDTDPLPKLADTDEDSTTD